ncbi:MAG: FGLLP motif-containing membrane protein [Acidimicrobiales bacterium]
MTAVPTTTAPVEPLGASLVVLTRSGTPRGPPGVQFGLTAAGFSECSQAIFTFDGVRIGAGTPDAEGVVRVRGLSVPGGVNPGAHGIAALCDGQPRATAGFTVTHADAHRSEFVTSLNQPWQVSTDPKAVAASAGLALLLVALVGFPSELFNATFNENQSEIRAWFRRRRKELGTGGPIRQAASFGAFIVAGGFLYAGLSADFGFNLSSLVLALGIALGLVVISLGFGAPANLFSRRTAGEWGRLGVIPGSLVVAALCVVASRVVGFQPGYLYGVLAGFTFKQAFDRRTEGRLAAAGCLAIMVVGIIAFLLKAPVAAAAGEPEAGLWLMGLEAALAAVFLLGIESLAVGLLPLRFLNGAKVLGWSKLAWAAMFTVALFLVIHVLLQPGSGYVGQGSSVVVPVVALYASFGLGSVAFWAYFRYRPESWKPRSIGDGGDYTDVERI